MHSGVFLTVETLDINYSFLYLLSLTLYERVRKKYLLGRPALCIKIASDPITFLIMMLIFRLMRRKLPFDLF